MTKRYYQIDYAKAIGIFLVLLGHTVINNNITDSFYIQTGIFVNSFHVPLFFILSGLVFGLKYFSKEMNINLKEEIVTRSKRLIIPYFIWNIICLVFLLLYTWYVAPEMCGDVFYEKSYAILSQIGIGPLWFFSTLYFGIVIFIPIINTKLFKSKMLISHILLFIISIALPVYINKYFQPYPYKMDFLFLYPIVSICRVLPALFFIEVGFLFSKLWEKYIRAGLNIRLSIFFILTILVFILREMFLTKIVFNIFLFILCQYI